MVSPHALERITNLAFVFLNAERLGHEYITREWVSEHVRSYTHNEKGQPRSKQAASKLFDRDLADLIATGMPIEICTVAGEKAYRLGDNGYLPSIQFSDQEATVIAVAGQIGTGGELSTFSRSGWTKLAAGGAQRTLGVRAPITSIDDWSRIPAQALDILLPAIAQHRRISFFYAVNTDADAVERWMDPWGIVFRKGRVYVVGFDLDRQAPRCFRALKLSQLEFLSTQQSQAFGAFHHNPGHDLEELVETQLGRNTKEGWVVFQADPDHQGARELIAQAESTPQGYRLNAVDMDWFTRTAAALAPHVIVSDPPEVIEDVVSLLQEVVKHHD